MENAINTNDVKVGSVVFSFLYKRFKTIKKEKIKLTNVDPLKVLAIRKIRNSGHEEYGISTTLYEVEDAKGNIFAIDADHVSLKAKDTFSMVYYIGLNLFRGVGMIATGWLIHYALSTTTIFNPVVL